MRVLILCFSIFTLFARAESWKTTDGKTYEDVKVLKVEDDAATILYKDGGVRVPLSTLSSDLQQKFHYDPAKAKIAADKFAADEKFSKIALSKEENSNNAKSVIINFRNALLSNLWNQGYGQKLSFSEQSARYGNRIVTWKISSDNQVTLTAYSTKNGYETAILNFNDDLSTFTGTDFNGNTISGTMVKVLSSFDKENIERQIAELTKQIDDTSRDASVRGREYEHEDSGITEGSAASHGAAYELLQKDNDLLRQLIAQRSALQAQLGVDTASMANAIRPIGIQISNPNQ